MDRDQKAVKPKPPVAAISMILLFSQSDYKGLLFKSWFY
jgi:hypothetical protein